MKCMWEYMAFSNTWCLPVHLTIDADRLGAPQGKTITLWAHVLTLFPNSQFMGKNI